MTHPTTRREFISEVVAGVTIAALAQDVLASQSPRPPRDCPRGRSGGPGSACRFSAWAAGTSGRRRPAEAIRIMHAAIDEGLTFFDNCWDYHDGGSEEVMGRALADGQPRRRLPHDQELRARLRGLEAVPRRQPAAPADRSHRPLAVPRDRLRQRPRLGLRERRHQGRHRGEARPARSVTSASPATRTRASTWRCSTSHSSGRRARCRSTSCDVHYRSFQKQVVPVCLKKQRRRDRHEGFRRRVGHPRARPGCRRRRRIAMRSASRWRRRSSASRRWSS